MLVCSRPFSSFHVEEIFTSFWGVRKNLKDEKGKGIEQIFEEHPEMGLLAEVVGSLVGVRMLCLYWKSSAQEVTGKLFC